MMLNIVLLAISSYLTAQNRYVLQFIYNLAIFCLFQIKKLFPSAGLKLPGKKFFGNTDPATILQRKEGLTDFLNKLVSNPHILKK